MNVLIMPDLLQEAQLLVRPFGHWFCLNLKTVFQDFGVEVSEVQVEGQIGLYQAGHYSIDNHVLNSRGSLSIRPSR